MRKTKLLLLISFLFLSCKAIQGQIEANSNGTVLLGGAKESSYTPTQAELESGIPRRFFNVNAEGLYWQNQSCYFQIDMGSNDSYPQVSGSGNKILLYNGQTNTYNVLNSLECYENLSATSMLSTKATESSYGIVSALQPVSYNWKSDLKNKKSLSMVVKHYGFLAQDVEKVFPQAVMTDLQQRKLVNYNSFVPLIAGSIQALQCNLVELQNEAKDLDTLSEVIRANDLYLLSSCCSQQNMSVTYNVASDAEDAFILITSLNGNVLQRYTLKDFGVQKKCDLSVNTLAAGLYNCTLFVNEKICRTRHLVITQYE